MTDALPILQPTPGRCTGDCCRAFWLPYSPEELRENYLAWAEQRFVEGKDRNGHPQGSDIWLIAPMAIHLGHFDRNPLKPDSPLLDGATADYYTCANLRPNGDCGIYAIRPGMCRDYPYGSPCSFEGCTLEGRGVDPEAAKALAACEAERQALEESSP